MSLTHEQAHIEYEPDTVGPEVLVPTLQEVGYWVARRAGPHRRRCNASPRSGAPSTGGPRPGLIFETDTYIPLESVVKGAGNEVFINLPKMGVGMMPWEEPISLEDFQEKNGPQAGDVTHLYRSRSPSGKEVST